MNGSTYSFKWVFAEKVSRCYRKQNIDNIELDLKKIKVFINLNFYMNFIGILENVHFNIIKKSPYIASITRLFCLHTLDEAPFMLFLLYRMIDFQVLNKSLILFQVL